MNNLQLIDLSPREMRETEGGFIPLIVLAAAVLLSGCAASKPAVGKKP